MARRTGEADTSRHAETHTRVRISYGHDKMHGEHGTYVMEMSTAASFEQNKGHGAGRYVLAEWVDNKTHGAGTRTSASGEVYVGEWALNKKHGRARHVN